ncbi:butyrophilin subfamily 1 member A1-like isoform X4 [Vulpes vulpes]|uniref:Butyrophilin subfamily 1 member A1-like isoform X4 n=1 Tax=Vulpes vulpes TaxID=9627 RepID=A0ABM4Y2A3_VULVU
MEDCCRHSLLSHLSSLLLLFQLPFAGSAEEFVVIGPSDPIVAMLGGDVMLPCHLSPAMDMENMELRWFRSKFSEAAFIYQNQQEQREEQLAQYAGRTSLVKDFLTQGEAAMRIHKVQAFDNGLYTCLFRKGNFYEEANLELMVAGVGSAPQVHIQGPEEDGIRVMCMASGWFPKPQVQWRALSGEKFLTFSETYAQDAEGLYSVEAALVVRDSSSGNVTCSVLNAILGQEKVMAIFIPGELQADLDWRKSVYLSAWRKAQLYAVSVTLDPESAHPNLAVSDEKTSVTWKDTCEIREESSVPSVLGCGAITSGCCFWEVEIRIRSRGEWALGVCRGDVNREGWYKELPEKGFWAVGKYGKSLCACDRSGTQLSLRQFPHRIGIFLDLKEGEEGEVSFYNMTDGSHIFSFSLPSSSGTLFPYFRLSSEDVLLTICSIVSEPAETPVPLNNPPSSLEEPMSLSEEGFSSGSVVDGALPGAESPLLSCSPEAMFP